MQYQLIVLLTAIVFAASTLTTRKAPPLLLRSIFTEQNGVTSFVKKCMSVAIMKRFVIAPTYCVKDNGQTANMVFIPQHSFDVVDSQSGLFYFNEIIFSTNITINEEIALINLPLPYKHETTFCIAKIEDATRYWADSFIPESFKKEEPSFMLKREPFFYRSEASHKDLHDGKPSIIYDSKGSFIGLHGNSYHVIEGSDYAEFLQMETEVDFQCRAVRKMKKRHHQCFRRSEVKDFRRSKRYVAAQKVSDNAHSYVVKLHMLNLNSAGTYVDICNGTIISDRFIITSKHCLLENPKAVLVEKRPIFQVQYNGYNISNFGIASKYHLYPKTDIALIEMDSAVTFESKISGIAKPEFYQTAKKFITLGFGCSVKSNECAAEHWPQVLMKTKNTIGEMREYDVISTPTENIALGGDSGGPALIVPPESNPASRPVDILMGVVFGTINGGEKNRAILIYQRLADWIATHTKVAVYDSATTTTAAPTTTTTKPNHEELRRF